MATLFWVVLLAAGHAFRYELFDSERLQLSLS